MGAPSGIPYVIVPSALIDPEFYGNGLSAGEFHCGVRCTGVDADRAEGR